MGILGRDRARTQRLSFLASVTVLWSAQRAVFQVMKAFFNLMSFVCILLVYFWKKYHLYVILLADLSL